MKLDDPEKIRHDLSLNSHVILDLELRWRATGDIKKRLTLMRKIQAARDYQRTLRQRLKRLQQGA